MGSINRLNVERNEYNNNVFYTHTERQSVWHSISLIFFVIRRFIIYTSINFNVSTNSRLVICHVSHLSHISVDFAACIFVHYNACSVGLYIQLNIFNRCSSEIAHPNLIKFHCDFGQIENSSLVRSFLWQRLESNVERKCSSSHSTIYF